MKKLIREIEETGVLPGGYFPSRYYPNALAVCNPGAVIAEYREHVERWLEWYPQDAETPYYAKLRLVYELTRGETSGGLD